MLKLVVFAVFLSLLVPLLITTLVNAFDEGSQQEKSRTVQFQHAMNEDMSALEFAGGTGIRPVPLSSSVGIDDAESAGALFEDASLDDNEIDPAGVKTGRLSAEDATLIDGQRSRAKRTSDVNSVHNHT